MPEDNRRIVLLNWLISRSTTHAREYDPPVEHASVLFDIIRARHAKGWAIEYVKGPDETDDAKRIKISGGHSFTRLSDISIEKTPEYQYVTLFIKYTDITLSGFPVEDTVSFAGREIAGKATERGVFGVHLVARLPLDESRFDDAKYRCVIESGPPLTRRHIEQFLCRQIRRHTDAENRTFGVDVVSPKRQKPSTKQFRYTPRLELNSEVGRSMKTGIPGGKELANMLFTKREEFHSTARGTEVRQRDFSGSVEIKISGRQAPVGSQEKETWIKDAIAYFTLQGYESKIYYRHANGGVVGGDLHQAVDGATDLLMCDREYITLSEPQKIWEPKANTELVAAMRGILDEDELWERSR